MEFINGMYDVDRSGDTEKMRMRGSGGSVRSVVVLVDADGCIMRLTTAIQIRQEAVLTLETHSIVLS
jgi:hypothetical protein